MPGLDAIPTIQLSADAGSRMPEYLAAMAQRHGPIFKRPIMAALRPQLGEWLVYLVGPEANKVVLQAQRDAFSHDRGWSPILGGIFEKGLLNTDDPLHARQRRLMNPAFTAAYMARYLPIMTRIVEERTREWSARTSIDLYAECRKITFDIAAETLIGLRTGAQVDRLRELFYALVSGAAPATITTEEQFMRYLYGVRAELDALLLETIAQRRQDGSDDVLGMLTAARDDDGLGFDDKEILGHLHILLVAGHETSTTLASWLFYELAAYPEYLQRVRTELDLVLGDGAALTPEAIRKMRWLGYAVDETTRLRSPVLSLPRGVSRDVEFGGYTIPTGTRVWLAVAASHRLPAVFDQPGLFDPDRFAAPREEDKKTPYGLVAFGGGPRICIGLNFAQMEVRALAAHVLRSYDLRPAAGSRVQQNGDGIIAALPGGMPMMVTARA